MIKRIAHVAIATQSIAVMADFYKTLGLEVDSVEVVKDQKVKVALMRVGDSAIELMEPTEENSIISRFIEKRGEGIHHICLEVDDIQQHLDVLKSKDIKLIDEKPRVGADGQLVAFVHPDSTGGVLIELCQPSEEDSR
ncbi:MAG TPA: methylmalonyl-CoA epimerase [Acidobacteriota bacterium]|nr:methylmalonyl-CoA epimerase [Acidobacteriota bacterium]